MSVEHKRRYSHAARRVRPCALYGFACLVLGLLAPFHLAFGALSNPSITLTVDEDKIHLGDIIVVEMQAVGVELPVDIGPLLVGADLLRQTLGTRIAVIQGRVVEVVVQRMELLPRREGLLGLGPIRAESLAGTVSSNRIALRIDPPPESNWQPAATEHQVRFRLSSAGFAPVEITASDSAHAAPDITLYPGQHLRLDISLRHQEAIVDEGIELPTFTGFDVLKEFAERRTIEDDEDGVNWRVTAWRYHLFARQAGEIEIGPVSWQGTAVRSRTQRAAFERRTHALSLTVQEAPVQMRWWLPASELTLEETWSMDPRTLSAGDEVLRTITLKARDVLSNHLPAVEPLASRALSTALIDEQRTQRIVGNHIEAQASFQFRMIAQSPIPVFLDTIRVPWFDTQSTSAREAIIPARRINVGLPARADVLASLANRESAVDKIMLSISAMTASWLPWHLLCIALSLAALLLWSLELQHWLRGMNPKRNPDSHRSLPEL